MASFGRKKNGKVNKSSVFRPSFFFCWREGRFSGKKMTRNKELISDGLRCLSVCLQSVGVCG